MDSEKQTKPASKRRSIGIGGLRARAAQHTDAALEAVKDVAASTEADPKARVEAAKAIVDYAMVGKDV